MLLSRSRILLLGIIVSLLVMSGILCLPNGSVIEVVQPHHGTDQRHQETDSRQISYTEKKQLVVNWEGNREMKVEILSDRVTSFSTPVSHSEGLILDETTGYTRQQSIIYRLKFSGCEFAPNFEFYPTLELAKLSARCKEFLQQHKLSLTISKADFDECLHGYRFTKIWYLEDLTLADNSTPPSKSPNIECIRSYELSPGEDPIIEAEKQGEVIAIIRLDGEHWQEYRERHGLGVQSLDSLPDEFSGISYGMPGVGIPIGLPPPTARIKE